MCMCVVSVCVCVHCTLWASARAFSFALCLIRSEPRAPVFSSLTGQLAAESWLCLLSQGELKLQAGGHLAVGGGS